MFSFISVFSSFAIINIIAIIMAARLYTGKELGKIEKNDKSIKIKYKTGRYFADCMFLSKVEGFLRFYPILK